MAEAVETVAGEVPGHEVRGHRRQRGGHEVQAQERRGPAVQGGRGGLPRRLRGRPLRQGRGRRTRSAPSAARRSRRSTPTSPATRPAPRRPSRRSRRSTGTRRTSSTRRSARSSALNQIAEGSVVVFQVAGQCGLGALDAAKEKSVQGIGVDADQGYLGDHIMTSAQKKVDVAVDRPRSRASRTARTRAAPTSSSTSRTTASASASTNAGRHQVRGPGHRDRRTRSRAARSPTSRPRSK